MSIGGKKSKGSETTTVQLPPWLDAEWQDAIKDASAFGQAPVQNYTGMFSAPQNQTWQSADQGLLNMSKAGPSEAMQAGQGALQAGLMYMPQQVRAPQVDTASINRGAVRDVSAGNVRDVSAYTNPYEDAVVQQTMSDIGQERDKALNAQGARAGSNLWGSRGAIMMGETAGQYADAAARAAAGLRQSGYTNAQQFASQDADRALSAGVANQNMDYGIAGQNAGFAQQSNQARANLGLSAAQGNQQAGLNAAGLRQNAATGLIGSDQQQQQLQGQFLQSLQQSGVDMQNMQQGDLDRRYQEFLRQQQAPIDAFNLRLSALGLAPYNKNSTTSSKSSSVGLMIG